MKFTGKAFKFGDNINTDYIISGRYKFAIQDPKELAKYVMEDIDPEFYKKVKDKNAFLVAGGNFGIGSSREQAPMAIKYAGIKAVIAKSFARIFYRNAFNIGLILIECDTTDISDGDELELDIDKGVLRNVSTCVGHKITPIPLFMRNLIKAGGAIEYINKTN